MIHGAVLGSPITHSLSPSLHNASYDYLGIEGDYSAIDVSVDSLADFFQENNDRYEYFSLTMPLKEVACSLPVQYTELPIQINSANTLVKRSSQWSLHSTDGSGFLSAINHSGLSRIESTLILGAGGTARAVAQSLDGRSKHIHILSRSTSRQSSIQNAITKSDFEFLSWSERVDLTSYDLIVNTTPAGAADLIAEQVQPKPRGLFFDVIYKPWPTVLARKWSDCGGEVINGLELLIYQGIDQLTLALNVEIDKEDLARHLRPILKN